MAPTETPVLAARQYGSCPSGTYYSRGYCYRNGWNSYGRWILAAAVIVFFFLVFFFWACINARRRRKNGVAPRYGTGWIAPGSKWNGPPPNNPGYYNPQGQPPPYNPQNGPGPYENNQSYPMQNHATGNTFQTTDGYYGQQNGISQPKNTYQPGSNDGVYAPPEGPPPNKAV